jgi:hypothetical protein
MLLETKWFLKCTQSSDTMQTDNCSFAGGQNKLNITNWDANLQSSLVSILYNCEELLQFLSTCPFRENSWLSLLSHNLRQWNDARVLRVVEIISYLLTNCELILQLFLNFHHQSPLWILPVGHLDSQERTNDVTSLKTSNLSVITAIIRAKNYSYSHYFIGKSFLFKFDGKSLLLLLIFQQATFNNMFNLLWFMFELIVASTAIACKHSVAPLIDSVLDNTVIFICYKNTQNKWKNNFLMLAMLQQVIAEWIRLRKAIT